VFNTPTKLILLGGLEVAQNTLLRFYVGHVVFLPLIAGRVPGRPLLANQKRRRDLRPALTTSGRR
jgi:hypothetical protein